MFLYLVHTDCPLLIVTTIWVYIIDKLHFTQQVDPQLLVETSLVSHAWFLLLLEVYLVQFQHLFVPS